jgi:hypothetical protein
MPKAVSRQSPSLEKTDTDSSGIISDRTQTMGQGRVQCESESKRCRVGFACQGSSVSHEQRYVILLDVLFAVLILPGRKPKFQKPRDDLPKPTKELQAREGDLGIEKNLNKTMLVQGGTLGGRGPKGPGFYVSFPSSA